MGVEQSAIKTLFKSIDAPEEGRGHGRGLGGKKGKIPARIEEGI